MARSRLEGLQERKGVESQVRLERLEVSDGTVGWDVVRVADGKPQGVIIRIQRIKPGGSARLSYYGRKDPLFFGCEFPSKEQAVRYIATT